MKKLLLGLGMTPFIILPMAAMVSCASVDEGTGDKVPDIVPPKPQEGVVTQEILGKAMVKAKQQYVDSKIAPDKFRAKDFDTEAKMNASAEFNGLENFNKNSRRIIIEEGSKFYTFTSEISHIEVDRLFANVKVFWRMKSITNNTLIGAGSFFTIEDFKVVTLDTKLRATGNTSSWTINPADLLVFNDTYLTSLKEAPLPEDFDVNRLSITSSTKPGIGLDGVKYFTKDELIKIKSHTTNALDSFKLFSFDTYEDYTTYVHALFDPWLPASKFQQLSIKFTRASGGDTFIANAEAIAAIKKTYFNDQFPSFGTIEINGGKDISGVPGMPKTVDIKLGRQGSSSYTAGKIVVIVGTKDVNVNLAGFYINDALNDIKIFLIQKLAHINMIFNVLGEDNHLLFTRFSKIILTKLIENAKTYIPELQVIYDKPIYGTTVKLFLNNGVKSIVERMADSLPL